MAIAQSRNPIVKYLHHKKMLKRFRSLISTDNKPDVVHIHTAADWSWKRKAQYVKFCNNHSILVLSIFTAENLVSGLGVRIVKMPLISEQRQTLLIVKSWFLLMAGKILCLT